MVFKSIFKIAYGFWLMSLRDAWLPDDNFENWKNHLLCLWRQKHKQRFVGHWQTDNFGAPFYGK